MFSVHRFIALPSDVAMEEKLSGSKANRPPGEEGGRFGAAPRDAYKSFAPREVSAHNPVDVTISKVGLGIVAASISLITISLVQSTQEDPSVELEKDNATIFLRENMEVIRNGSYNYGSNSEFAVIQSGVIDSWLTALDSGMIRYNYGDSINNFCWDARDFVASFAHQRLARWLNFLQKRKEIPENEFLPSLFRSSQLFVGVQVLIRAAILFSLLHRILLLSATLCLYSRRRSMWFTTIPLAIINETLHVIAIFIVFTIHIGQDYQYSQTSAIALAIALVTFVMKMFLLSTIKVGIKFLQTDLHITAVYGGNLRMAICPGDVGQLCARSNRWAVVVLHC
ncbi:hypothetical protein OSTOST_04625 [Ostertagia ostertagi]